MWAPLNGGGGTTEPIDYEDDDEDWLSDPIGTATDTVDSGTSYVTDTVDSGSNLVDDTFDLGGSPDVPEWPGWSAFVDTPEWPGWDSLVDVPSFDLEVPEWPGWDSLIDVPSFDLEVPDWSDRFEIPDLTAPDLEFGFPDLEMPDVDLEGLGDLPRALGELVGAAMAIPMQILAGIGEGSGATSKLRTLALVGVAIVAAAVVFGGDGS